METNNRDKRIDFFIVAAQICFLLMGLFLFYTRNYGPAAGVLILTAGSPFMRSRGNRPISFLSWIAIGLALVALAAWFFQR